MLLKLTGVALYEEHYDRNPRDWFEQTRQANVMIPPFVDTQYGELKGHLIVEHETDSCGLKFESEYDHLVFSRNYCGIHSIELASNENTISIALQTRVLLTREINRALDMRPSCKPGEQTDRNGT